MRKTKWLIIDETEQTVTTLTYYHFGKEPKFPSWYMESNHEYKIETLFSFELIKTLELFFKCLTHFFLHHRMRDFISHFFICPLDKWRGADHESAPKFHYTTCLTFLSSIFLSSTCTKIFPQFWWFCTLQILKNFDKIILQS